MREVTPPFGRTVLEALLLALLAGAVAFAVNALRPDGIPPVQREPHAILVPCPVAGGEAEAVPPDEVPAGDARVLLVDARPEADFAAWHLPDALGVPYDWLEPVPEETVRAILATGAARVIVYGDGADPDAGEQLARELAGRGLRHVGFVAGGAPALRETGR